MQRSCPDRSNRCGQAPSRRALACCGAPLSLRLSSTRSCRQPRPAVLAVHSLPRLVKGGAVLRSEEPVQYRQYRGRQPGGYDQRLRRAGRNAALQRQRISERRQERIRSADHAARFEVLVLGGRTSRPAGGDGGAYARRFGAIAGGARRRIDAPGQARPQRSAEAGRQRARVDTSRGVQSDGRQPGRRSERQRRGLKRKHVGRRDQDRESRIEVSGLPRRADNPTTR